MDETIGQALDERVEPRFAAIENGLRARLSGVESVLCAVEKGQQTLGRELHAIRTSIDSLASVEQRLSISDRVAILEATVEQLKRQ